MKLSLLIERLFTPPARQAITKDRSFSVEWDDGVMQYVVFGKQTGHKYGYFSDEVTARRFVRRMSRKS